MTVDQPMDHSADHPATERLPAQPPPPGQPQPPRQARKRWVLPATLGVLLLVGVLAAAAVVARTRTDASQRDAVASAGIDEVSDVGSLDELIDPVADPDLGAKGPWAAPGASDAPDAGKAHGQPWRDGRPGRRPLRLAEGEKVLAGSVSSTADGKLVIRKDNGAEVSVPTDNGTKVRGAGNRALADLQPGERVVIKVGSNGVAAAVLAVKAHAAGTITKLDGDRATLVRVGGLSTTLDLSAVTARPAVGTVVVAVGTATDGGATLKVEQIKELPTLG